MKKISNKKKFFQRKGKKEETLNLRVLFFFFLISFFISFFVVYIFSFKKTSLIRKNQINQKTVLKGEIEYSFSKIKEFLSFKNSFYYDPLNLINDFKKQTDEILLIDCRDKNSFTKEHIKNAISFQSIEQILKLAKDKKLLILYGDYQDEPKVNEIALALVKKGLKVKVLSVGYNQFRHLKIFWLPQSLWDEVNPEEFIELKKS